MKNSRVRPAYAMVLLLMLICFGFVRAAEKTEKDLDYAIVERHDDRSLYKLIIETESPGVFARRIDTFYAIPASSATARERLMGAQVQAATMVKEGSGASGFTLDVIGRAGSIEVRILCDLRTRAQEIEREANFLVASLESVEGEKAKIVYRVSWSREKGEPHKATKAR